MAIASLGVALVAAVLAAALLVVGTDTYLQATRPDCSTNESHPALDCADPGDRRRQAAASGLAGGVACGLVVGCVAWRRRSRRG